MTIKPDPSKREFTKLVKHWRELGDASLKEARYFDGKGKPDKASLMSGRAQSYAEAANDLEQVILGRRLFP